MPTARVRGWLDACVNAVEALAFPWQCQICGAEGPTSPFCDACRRELIAAAGDACARCAMPIGPWGRLDGGCSVCRGRALGFDTAVALGPYRGPIRHLCLLLKQERNAWLARWLADLLVDAWAETLAGDAEARVVPIPLHWRRRWSRGYNQAESLASRLAHRLGLRMVPGLSRKVATRPLAGLGRVERAKMVQGAFRVRAGSVRMLEGRGVILVDDILTSGATSGAAARALKRSGATRVMVAVVGRAEGFS